MNFKRLLTCLLLIIFAQVTYAQHRDATPITSENVHLLKEIALVGEGTFTGIPKWSPDGAYIALAGTRGAWVFPVDDFANPILLEHRTSVEDVVWSLSGDRLTSLSDDESLVWSVADWTLQERLSGAYQIAYSPNGHYRVETILSEVGSTGLDTAAVFTLYNNLTEEAIALGNIETIENAYYTTGYAVFSENSTYFVTAFSCYLWQYCEQSSYFSIWSIDDGSPSVVDEMIIGRSVISLDGSDIAYIDENGEITLLNIETGEMHIIEDLNPTTIGFSGTHLLVITDDLDQNLNFVDPVTGEISWSTSLPTGSSYSISPDGTRFVGTDYQNISLFDIHSLELVQRESFVLDAPDYSSLALTEGDLAVPPYPCERLILTNDSETLCGAYNFDETYFVGETYCTAKCVYQWDVETLTTQHIVDVNPNDFAGHFIFYNDTNTFAFEVSHCFANMRCTGSTIYLWQIGQTAPIVEISTRVVNQLFFAPSSNQNLLVAITTDDIIFVDTETGELLSNLYAKTSNVLSATFSNDGTQFFTQHFGASVRVWQIP